MVIISNLLFIVQISLLTSAPLGPAGPRGPGGPGGPYSNTQPENIRKYIYFNRDSKH